MNVLNTTDEQAFSQAKRSELLGMGLDRLRALATSVSDVRQALDTLIDIGDDNIARRCERMVRQLEAFEPSVTMIGQIKSGKTTLVNAVLGVPDLLPADVNPWTSVVTSMHLNPEREGFENSASFKFFDEDEWDRLVTGGGRIGELASRAGADEELEKIKQQVAAMREKSRQRLGRKFEVMLGQQRDYGYFDKDLIERYVCLGEEPDETDENVKDDQGRFADITKSADVHMQRTGIPLRLCLRDTPGVNDTFMMREQITIRAIRNSRICVVVLSAHQALSSTDMALIRLITHVKSRDVIIFVNRIDELSDPAAQVPQIRDSIAATLARHKGPENAQVIFGSALWASYALCATVRKLPAANARALDNWMIAMAAEFETAGLDRNDAEASAWFASGLPALQAALSARIEEGIGSATLQRIAASARNLAAGIEAADRVTDEQIDPRVDATLAGEEAQALMTQLTHRHKAALDAQFDEIIANFADRMERVQDSFLERATVSLVAHLEEHGEISPWTYDPAGLRALLSSSHKVLARKSRAAFEKTTQVVATEVSEVYARAFSMGMQAIEISVPRPPEVPPPVSLGRTIALDLNGNWWKRWWMQRRGYKAYAASFYDLIKSETSPVIAELRDELAQSVRKESCMVFEEFLDEQLSVFQSLEETRNSGSTDLSERLGAFDPAERQARLRQAIDTLNGYASL